MGVRRRYSVFWSDQEYMFVAKGQVLRPAVYACVKSKFLKIITALREIENGDAVDDSTLSELVRAIAHLLKIKGYDSEAEMLENIAEKIER